MIGASAKGLLTLEIQETNEWAEEARDHVVRATDRSMEATKAGRRSKTMGIQRQFSNHRHHLHHYHLMRLLINLALRVEIVQFANNQGIGTNSALTGLFRQQRLGPRQSKS